MSGFNSEIWFHSLTELTDKFYRISAVRDSAYIGYDPKWADKVKLQYKNRLSTLKKRCSEPIIYPIIE